MAIINVILSGGVGSRLWPLSRKSRPKQYIPLFEGNTLFQLTAKRNSPLVDSMQVVGSIDNYQRSRNDFEQVGISKYSEIIEATPRNTAASIAFAAFNAAPEDILLVTPSDHIIGKEIEYKHAIEQATSLAIQGHVVTFGIKPLRPETGYGYIEHDTDLNVQSFKEKPDAATAEQYLNAGNYLWNSGMFCFRADVYLNELQQYAPEVYLTAKATFEAAENGFLPLDLSMQIPSISVDYAVMEHSKKIKVVPCSFNWSDLGSFEAIWEYMEQHDGYKASNLVLGTQKRVEFVGVENLVLVETDDAILVVPRNKTQDVKKVYERLETEDPELLK